MKNCAFVAALLGLFVAGGCNPGGEKGDPNVGATPGPPASTQYTGARPGTPGAPVRQAAPSQDPLAGRTGAAAGQ